MSTKRVDVQEAQSSLSELLSLVGDGTEVILTRDEMPVARLVPIVRKKSGRVAGLHRGQVWMSDDFDAPLIGV